MASSGSRRVRRSYELEWCLPGDDRDIYRAIAKGSSETSPRTFGHADLYLLKSSCEVNKRRT